MIGSSVKNNKEIHAINRCVIERRLVELYPQRDRPMGRQKYTTAFLRSILHFLCACYCRMILILFRVIGLVPFGPMIYLDRAEASGVMVMGVDNTTSEILQPDH